MMAVFWISKLSSSWRNKSSVRNFKAHQEGVVPLKKKKTAAASRSPVTSARVFSVPEC